jgi:hypothetical protein
MDRLIKEVGIERMSGRLNHRWAKSECDHARKRAQMPRQRLGILRVAAVQRHTVLELLCPGRACAGEMWDRQAVAGDHLA